MCGGTARVSHILIIAACLNAIDRFRRIYTREQATFSCKLEAGARSVADEARCSMFLDGIFTHSNDGRVFTNCAAPLVHWWLLTKAAYQSPPTCSPTGMHNWEKYDKKKGGETLILCTLSFAEDIFGSTDIDAYSETKKKRIKRNYKGSDATHSRRQQLSSLNKQFQRNGAL